MLERTTLQFRRIACKQDHDGMQVGACRLVDPVRGIIASGIAEHLRSRHHALAEFLRRACERCLVHPERTQAVPGECHGDPALVLLHGFAHGLRGVDLVQDGGEPRPPTGRIGEREELVAAGQRRGASQQDVLDVVSFKHGGLALAHCI